MELDVVAIKGFRLFVFSCSVDTGKGLLKEKLFEARNRAARLGGEHAKAALVCMSGNPLDILKTVTEEHWEGHDTLRVFGADHVAGRAAPCRRGNDGRPGSDMTLVDGISDWVNA